MKKQLVMFGCVFFILMFFLVFHGFCAGFDVIEGKAKVPRRKIGELEVSVKPSWHSRHMSELNRAQYIKHELSARLQKKGQRYHADAIDEVRYFPDPKGSTYFRSKKYYARGSLIEYAKFPASKEEPKAAK